MPHLLEGGGAPAVFYELLQAVREAEPEIPILVVSGTAREEAISKFAALGVDVLIVPHPNCVYRFAPGDVLLLNSRGHDFVDYTQLFGGPLKDALSHIFWYVHESDPEFLLGELKKQVSDLLNAGKMHFLTPALQAARNYREYFNNQEAVQVQGFRSLPPFRRTLEASAFSEKLTGVLVGDESKGRKGHATIGYAYLSLLDQYVSKDPKLYRKPHLNFVGIGELPLWLSQVCEQLNNAFGKKFVPYGVLPKDKCLSVIFNSNMTICASYMECLPNSVFEGMFAGHPLVRNGCSGVDEQLIDGENGYLFNDKSFKSVVQTLERIHNREKTSDEKLAAMSAKSLEIAMKQEQNSFDPIVKQIESYLSVSK